MGKSRRMTGFDPRPAYVVFVVKRVAVGRSFLSVLQFSPASVIPAEFHSHSFIYHRLCVILTTDDVAK